MVRLRSRILMAYIHAISYLLISLVSTAIELKYDARSLVNIWISIHDIWQAITRDKWDRRLSQPSQSRRVPLPILSAAHPKSAHRKAGPPFGIPSAGFVPLPLSWPIIRLSSKHNGFLHPFTYRLVHICAFTAVQLLTAVRSPLHLHPTDQTSEYSRRNIHCHWSRPQPCRKSCLLKGKVHLKLFLETDSRVGSRANNLLLQLRKNRCCTHIYSRSST